MMIRRAAALALALVALLPVAAQALTLPPNAIATADTSVTWGSFAIPVGPFADGGVEKLVAEGSINHSAWQIRGGAATTLQLLAPLRDQLQDAGFEVLFECSTTECGGFDFRYETLVLPEPDMHVDLGDFRYLAAVQMAGDHPEFVALLVSRSSESGFVQMTRVGAAPQAAVAATASGKTPDATASNKTPDAPAPIAATVSQPVGGSLAMQLDATGAANLDDLVFEPGSAALGAGEFASLAELAALLLANPDQRLTLVGHTDATGSLDANIALSKRRAQSVVDRLVSSFAVPVAQISAEGAGYLAPRASNVSEGGRALNRRVEAVLAVP